MSIRGKGEIGEGVIGSDKFEILCARGRALKAAKFGG